MTDKFRFVCAVYENGCQSFDELIAGQVSVSFVVDPN